MRGKRLASLVHVAKSTLGVLFGIAVLIILADSAHTTLLLPPFAASAALALVARGNLFGRLRSIVGGYPVSATSGLAVLTVLGYGSAARVTAVAVAVAAMLPVRALHPPAAALPLLVLPGEPRVVIVLGTVLIGAFVLVGLAGSVNGLLPEPTNPSEAEGVLRSRRQVSPGHGTHSEEVTAMPDGLRARRGRGVA